MFVCFLHLQISLLLETFHPSLLSAPLEIYLVGCCLLQLYLPFFDEFSFF